MVEGVGKRRTDSILEQKLEKRRKGAMGEEKKSWKMKNSKGVTVRNMELQLSTDEHT